MPLSRLRLRLAVWYAIAYLAGLTALDLSMYGYLRLKSDRRLTSELRSKARAFLQATELEFAEASAAGVAAAGQEALRELPPAPEAYAIVDASGAVLAERGPTKWLAVGRSAPLSATVVDLGVGDEDPVRRVLVWRSETPEFGAMVLGSDADTAEEDEVLALWLTLSAPVVLLLGLAGGYVLSRRALQPIEALRQAIAQISPASLEQRLKVAAKPDELDGLKLQFNALLDRLERAQLQNRRFLRQAAHQIRTPLTLVLGEASLEQDNPEHDPGAALRRIRLAAEQMQRRVDELFLLAEAQSGSAPPVDETVELDALVLEGADVMRSRAQALGRRLELGDVAGVTVRGNNSLLREAVLELTENALRHGVPEVAVRLMVSDAGETARLTVSSGGSPFNLNDASQDPMTSSSGSGLGLSILHWIVTLHGGYLDIASKDGLNEVTLVLPRRRSH